MTIRRRPPDPQCYPTCNSRINIHTKNWRGRAEEKGRRGKKSWGFGGVRVGLGSAGLSWAEFFFWWCDLICYTYAILLLNIDSLLLLFATQPTHINFTG